jgi:CSLREA domain-containing protein
MVRRNPAIHPAGFESVVQRGTVAGTRAVLRMRAMLAAAIFVAFALTLSTAVRAATTITVNSLADTGAAGICTLRDAITAVNTKTATNGCAAGTYKDAINFSVTGTIALASTLPQVTGFFLTINGPPSPGITINGGGKVQVMMVASGTTLNLNGLTIAGGGIYNNGTLTVTNTAFSDCYSGGNGGGIYNNNNGTLTVINGTFSRNIAYTGGGGIYNAGTLTVINSTFARNRTFDLGGGIFDEARGG